MKVPGPPPPPYHAVGTEPFWNLLIDEHDIIFAEPDAQPIKQPTPKVIIGIAGEIYQTPRINVNIVHAQCSDGMSDRSYPDKVQVTVDGKSSTAAEDFRLYSAAICDGSSLDGVDDAIFVSGRGATSTIGGLSSVLALPAPRVSNLLAWVRTWLSKLPTI